MGEAAPELSIQQTQVLDSLQPHAKATSSKNTFSRKLIKHLQSEYNLEHHAKDWISLALSGVLVKKGPKLPIGYAGCKKIDMLSVWRQSADGKHIDIEKLGFAPRILRLNPEALSFEFHKHNYKRPGVVSCQDATNDSASSSELLEGYSMSVDEVAVDNEDDQEGAARAVGQAGHCHCELILDREVRAEALLVLWPGALLGRIEVFNAGGSRRRAIAPVAASHC